jgi:hypothetical protein
VRAVAVGALARGGFQQELQRDLADPSAQVRKGALLAVRMAAGSSLPLSPVPRQAMARLLRDRDEDVRKLALVVAAETMDLSLRPLLASVLTRAHPSAELVRLYLAIRQLLTVRELAHLRARIPRSTAGDAPDPDDVAAVVRDTRLPPEARALALAHLGSPDTDERLRLVEGLARHRYNDLAAEAIRSLATSTRPEAATFLVALARDVTVSGPARAEAVAALAGNADLVAGIAGLTADPEPLVRQIATRVSQSASDVAAPEDSRRPSNADSWQRALARGGDARAGRLLFGLPRLSCTRCHSIDGRGGRLGPDLSHAAASMGRARIVDSILDPSAEVSPEFQAYAVTMRTGEEFLGSQLHLHGNDEISLRLVDGRDTTLRLDDVSSWGAADASFMPQGLEAGMTVEEFRDLVAYLSSRR